jgi:hypothetical protein
VSIAWTEQVLPVNGIDLHVTQAGTGEPLLMIHGVTVDATFEHHEIEQLADTYQCADSAVSMRASRSRSSRVVTWIRSTNEGRVRSSARQAAERSRHRRSGVARRVAAARRPQTAVKLEVGDVGRVGD